jgi:hypothetical protein
MINEHDIQDFQEEDVLLLETTVHGRHDDYSTAVHKNGPWLLLSQDTNRDDPDADDVIALDCNTQHALYLILKERFEPLADAR